MSTSEDRLKLYIDEKWYIPIDKEGYCNGPCYEGALGIVLQIKNDRGGVYAIKIPRLLADTLKENAYICELLNEEERNVTEIFTTKDDVSRDGLLRGSLLNEKIIQTPVESKNSENKEARKQHGQIITVQFHKGKPPRFCGLKLNEKDSKAIDLYPVGVTINELPLKDGADFEKLERNAKKNESPWKRTVVLYEPNENNRQINYLDISEFLMEDTTYENLWYVGMPSIVYEWGNGTLSEIIVNQKMPDWELPEYLNLTNTLLQGLNALHHRKIIHTDMRPANIMYMGIHDNPKHYKLIDYGSFNKHDDGVEDGNKVKREKENQILGPTMSRERVSPFYAPERKNTIERENADTAVFINDTKNKDAVRILLGWRSDILEDDAVREGYVEEINEYIFPSMKEEEDREEYDQALLIPGDKIQIREYIFQIQDIGATENGDRVLLCSKKYWKIFHGKIITISDEEIINHSWMSIPRTIELRQWSYATDIYGIGAMFFYTLFWGGTTGEEKKTAEIEFADMLHELDSIPFFKNMWIDLAPLCAQIEDFYDNDSSKQSIEDFIFNPENYLSLSFYTDDIKRGEIKKKSFLEYAKYITFLITYSVKGTRKILKLLDYNYIYFIYSIHFGLCCIHRKVSLRSKNWENLEKEAGTVLKDSERITYPFCEDRVNKRSGKNTAADTAIKYLDSFIKIINGKKFKAFTLSEEERERNNPQYIPATELRRRFAELNDQHNAAKLKLANEFDKVRKLNELKEKLEQEFKKIKTSKIELENENNSVKTEIVTKTKSNQNLSQEGKILQKKLAEIEKLKFNLEEKYTELKDESDSLNKEHGKLKEKYSDILNVNSDIKVGLYKVLKNPKKKMLGGYDEEIIELVSQFIAQMKS